MSEYLFSYGTLQLAVVQRATFGGVIPLAEDALPGFRLSMLEIGDPAVVALSGNATHPILRRTGDPADVVSGSVLELTAEQLAAADGYEVADYTRVAATLASGIKAWVYIAR